MEWINKNPDRAARLRRKLRETDKDKISRRKYVLEKTFGITIDEYNDILEKQGGTCAICKSPPTNKKLAVDHCHETGRVRGLLCQGCNLGIGNLKESEDNLKSAILYLREN